VTIIVTAAREFLMIISGVLTPKMETAVRLLRSFVEYASFLGTVYAALIMLGMDISSLVASAGIMTLIVGLGAEDMVKDLVSGLFLIFESEFQVGDRIVVQGKTGQVREIGILSTKMVDENNNIFIVSNKEVSDVLNQTVRSSFTVIRFQLSSAIPIRKVQEVFARELPALKEKYQDLISEPRLRGIRNFSEGKMDCQIICEVQETKRFDLTCNMNREIMRIIEILKNEEGKEGKA
jgi:small conductance mechanosensitive channel